MTVFRIGPTWVRGRYRERSSYELRLRAPLRQQTLDVRRRGYGDLSHDFVQHHLPPQLGRRQTAEGLTEDKQNCSGFSPCVGGAIGNRICCRLRLYVEMLKQTRMKSLTRKAGRRENPVLQG